MSIQGVVSKAAQGVKAVLKPLGSKEESISFVRFHNEPGPTTPPALTPTTALADHTELSTIPNGSNGPATKEELTADGYWVIKDGDGTQGEERHLVVHQERRRKRRLWWILWTMRVTKTEYLRGKLAGMSPMLFRYVTIYFQNSSSDMQVTILYWGL